MAIKHCWHCGYPFAVSHEHKATGHKVLTCARCDYPWNLDDEIGLQIMEEEDKEFAEQWRAARDARA